MSCYHPYAAVKQPDGKLRFLSGWNSYEELKIMEPQAMLLPCNHCIGCKMDHSRRWADRMLLELESHHGKGLFLTLTYNCREVVDLEGKKLCQCEYPDVSNTKDCPLHEVCLYKCRISGSLYKAHVSQFIKRLREKLSYYDDGIERFDGVHIKFYGVGEYGAESNSHRPHYHIILFGLGLDDLKVKIPVGKNELRQPVYTNPFIASCWPYGNISFGDVSWNSCAYVARYVNKKVLDPNNDDFLDSLGKAHMFSLMSRRPGIGRSYLNEHPDCLDYHNISVSTPKGCKTIAIPRYFIDQLKRHCSENSTDLDLYDEDRYDTIMSQRALFAQDALMNKLAQTDLPLYDYLEVEENNMLARVKCLKRDVQNLY